MSAQDRTEQVLREFHILLSNSELYHGEANRIIVNKKEVLELLKRLNICIYEIMEEYELTQQRRDKAEREARKAGEEIVLDANKKAEDVYAASVLYTDEALRRVQGIMQEASDSVKEIYEKMGAGLKQEKEKVQRDQSELKSHLQDLKDTDKYMKLIDAANKEMAKEKAKERKTEEPSVHVKPEIKINMEYFEKAGIAPEEALKEEPEEEKKESAPAEVNVNLNAEYFKRKGDGNTGNLAGEKAEKRSLFGKIVK